MENLFIPVNIACLTISDTRDESNDTSGQFLKKSVEEEGHVFVDSKIVPDNIYHIRSAVSNWIVQKNIHVILSTGGTGISKTDVTIEAITPLFDKTVDGFGELFRYISYKEIGTSTIQSRVCAGISNNTIIFALPGSPKACQTGWNIIKEQLNKQKKSCNFINLLFQDEIFPNKKD